MTRPWIAAVVLVMAGCPDGHPAEDTYTAPLPIYDVADVSEPEDTSSPDIEGPAPDVPAAGEDAPDTGLCVESDVGNPCTGLEFNAEAGQCEYVSVNTGMACGEATCVHTVGACANGVCEPGPAPCQGVDPDGCWTESCEDATVSCVKEPRDDGTPCTGGRACLGGTCSYTPVCTGQAIPAVHEYDADCAGNTGCTEMCQPDKCSCWLCDGPFCVENGCDDSVILAPPPAVDVSLTGAWQDEPVGGVGLVGTIVTASASAAWSADSPLTVQVVVQLPGIVEEARWKEAGVEKFAPIVSPKIKAVRLLVASVTVTPVPCKGTSETSATGAPAAVLQANEDLGTSEFNLIATDGGPTLVAFVRILEDVGGARYYQWVRLGGFVADVKNPPSGPQELTTQVYAPIPATAVQPLGGLFSGVDWQALIDPDPV